MIRSEIEKDVNVMNTFSQNDFVLIGKCMNRTKLKYQPKLPKCLNDVHDCLPECNIETVTGEKFLLVNDKLSNIFILSCTTNLQFLCSVDIIMIDGTFTYCTKFFTQLVTVIGFKNGVYVPLVFCVLKDKKEQSYDYILASIQNECTMRNLIFSPKYVICDFERALMNSAHKIFPNTTVFGCRFHLSQSWWRRIAAVGLTAEYKNPNSEIGKWLHYVFGLTFLPPCAVEDAFLLLMAEQPLDERLVKFTDYVVENYIQEDAIFPPTLWAVLDNSVWRTNNGCEAFHSKFNAESQSPHPNVFQFIDQIKKNAN